MGMKSDIDIAWAAGLFEGEGTITTGRRPHDVRIALVMGDRDVVERFSDIVGGSVRSWYPPRMKEAGWSRMTYWNASGARAADVLRLLSPHFGNRRSARALEALSLFDAHVAEVTVERACLQCRTAFRPGYSASSAVKCYCSKRCANASRNRAKVA